MKETMIDFRSIPQLNYKDINYTENPEKLQEFIAFLPSEDGLLDAINERTKFPINRDVLVLELERQYNDMSRFDAIKNNLAALKDEDCMTVITAHQPCLLTGPLYYIFKIIDTINLAEYLSTKSDKKIVPVFINGSEDHDFEEINHFYLFGKKISWERPHIGSVGRLTTDGLEEVIGQLEEILGKQNNSQNIIQLFRQSLEKSTNYNDFVRQYLHEIFGRYGLIIINMDNHAFKAEFANVIKQELLNPMSKKLVSDTQQKLSLIGFGDQAHAREINLFYIDDHGRNRIEKQGNRYHIVDTDVSFSEEEILMELENRPERFSPNVILRPLYQEFILPNIAYIGGGGEIAYWLERKSLFQHYHIFYPALIRRNSVALLPKFIQKNLLKLDINVEELLGTEDEVVNKYVYNHASVELDLSPFKHEIENLYDKIAIIGGEVDATLSPSIKAEGNEQLKKLDQIEAKIRKSIKQKEEVQLNQLRKTYQYIFPEQGLQERRTNIIEFWVKDADIFDKLKQHLKPFNNKFRFLELES